MVAVVCSGRTEDACGVLVGMNDGRAFAHETVADSNEMW